MIIKRILQGLLSFVILVSITNNLNAQVTIGLLDKPSSGSLLQLKNFEGISDGSANANKGLVMPRVELSSITDLYPMFSTGYDKGVHDLPHTGLIVYNTNENLFNGDGAGIYVWDGEKWMGIGLTNRSIDANNKMIYLSRRSTTADAKIITTPEGLPWSLTTDNSVKSSKCETTSNDLLFTKGDDISICGNKIFTFTLDNSDKAVEIEVAHIRLSLTKSTFKVGEEGTTVASSGAVVAEGGDREWYIKDYSGADIDWVVPPYNDNNMLRFEIGPATREGSVYGTITVAHVNDPLLTEEIIIEQNKDYWILPEFDYLVIKYVYQRPSGATGNVDLDTATEFMNTGVPDVDGKPLGYGFNRSTRPNDFGYSTSVGQTGGSLSYAAYGTTFLYWGDDNTVDGYETVYANMTALTDDIFVEAEKQGHAPKREFLVDMYCTWWSISDSEYSLDKKISIQITLYKGGNMVKNGFDFNNDGEGVEVFDKGKDGLVVLSRVKTPLLYRSKFSHMLRLEYDKEDQTGVLIIPDVSDDQVGRSTINYPEVKSGESKMDYSIRIGKYIESLNKR